MPTTTSLLAANRVLPTVSPASDLITDFDAMGGIVPPALAARHCTPATTYDLLSHSVGTPAKAEGAHKETMAATT